jgi:two-component system phosphate regulon sensor histidine kinase PhoR
MIEKILETATLNHEELKITKKPVNITNLIEEIITKYQLLSKGKTIFFKSTIPNKLIKLDAFHFENAIGNIFDNAIKYGGNTIEAELTSNKNSIILTISDDGNGIPKNQKDKIFEQFYRIPTGNTHTIKGFGIGLYYTKNIIEKHGGSIQVIYDKNNRTLFKIELPNE